MQRTYEVIGYYVESSHGHATLEAAKAAVDAQVEPEVADWVEVSGGSWHALLRRCRWRHVLCIAVVREDLGPW